MIFHLSEKCSPDIEEYQSIRLLNVIRMTKCKERILYTGWSVLDVYDTCESCFSSFMIIFKSIYNESFPFMKTKRKYRNRLPWLTAGFKECIRRKNKLFRIPLKHPTSYNYTLYRIYKNVLKNLFKVEGKYQYLILANRNNLKTSNRSLINRNVQNYHHNYSIMAVFWMITNLLLMHLMLIL